MGTSEFIASLISIFVARFHAVSNPIISAASDLVRTHGTWSLSLGARTSFAGITRRRSASEGIHASAATRSMMPMSLADGVNVALARKRAVANAILRERRWWRDILLPTRHPREREPTDRSRRRHR